MADDDVTPTVEDVIAWGIHHACGCDGTCPPDDEDRKGARNVVAAVRTMTPHQLADLTGGMTEWALFGQVGGYWRTAQDSADEAHLRRMAADSGGEMRARVVGPWRAEP